MGSGIGAPAKKRKPVPAAKPVRPPTKKRAQAVKAPRKKLPGVKSTIVSDGPTRDLVVRLMGDGMSQMAVARKIGISCKSWYNLIKRDELFAAAVEEGVLASQAWWEEQGRKNLHVREFNHILWFMNIKNRFPSHWRDRQEVDNVHTFKLDELVAASLEGIRASPKRQD